MTNSSIVPRFQKRAAAAFLLIVSLAACRCEADESGATVLSVDLAQPGRPISTDLLGIFFEDINYAADGGLYAELVQNRSFEYQTTEQLSWSAITSWELVTRDGGRGSLSIESAVPVHPNNRHYVVVDTQQTGAGVGLVNSGFDGIAVKAGDLILKLVNTGSTAQRLRVQLTGTARVGSRARQTVLAADNPAAANNFANPLNVQPRTSEIPVGSNFDCEAPANSLTVFRIPKG